MSELPVGWAEATIGDVADYVSRGKSPKYADMSSLPVVNQRAIRWFGIQDEHLKFVHPEQVPDWFPERFIRAGDILWNSTGTGTIGRACLVRPQHLSPPKVVDSHVTIVRPLLAVIEPRYLFAWIRGPVTQRSIEDLATGTTNQVELSRSTVVATKLPIAPLPEQKRIADKLDALLVRLDACRERLDCIPGILKRFRQSVLAAASSGELSRDWRASRTECGAGMSADRADHRVVGLPQTWRNATLADVAQKGTAISYGIVLPGAHIADGVPYVRQQDIENGSVKVDQLARTSPEIAAAHQRSSLQEGDVLLCIIRNLRVAVVPRGMDGANLTQGTVRIRPAAFVNSEYLAAYLSSPVAQEWMKRCYIGMAMPRINVADARAVPVAIPPVDEQREIARRLRGIMGLAEQLEAAALSGIEKLDRIKQAALSKAFRGELVAQDRSDEPADALLARVRSEREQPPQPRRRTRARG